MVDRNLYKKVLVIGSRKVGKTSLISGAICNGTNEYYSPTTHMDVFWDLRRGLQYVDTPGVDGSILSEKSYAAFATDPQVREYTSQQAPTSTKTNEGGANASANNDETTGGGGGKHQDNNAMMFGDVDLSTVVAIIIVHTEEDGTRVMAEALKHTIRQQRHAHGLRIYIVANRGEIDPLPDDVYRRKKGEGVFDDLPDSAWLGTTDEATRYATVCVANMYGVDDLLDTVMEDTKSGIGVGGMKRLARNGSGSGRACGKNECTIQ